MRLDWKKNENLLQFFEKWTHLFNPTLFHLEFHNNKNINKNVKEWKKYANTNQNTGYSCMKTYVFIVFV